MPRAARLLTGAAALLLGAAAPAPEIGFPAPRIFPESITITRGGELFASDAGDGTIWHARPGDAQASVWLAPAASGLKTLLGVFADEVNGTLWACSRGLAGQSDAERDAGSVLLAFDLHTKAPKGRYPMPGGAKDNCNDAAVARDGTLYVAETSGGRVLRLKRGAAALEQWLIDPRLAGVDGIAFDRDGTLYASTVFTSRFFRLPIAADGTAATPVELTPSQPADRADGLRSIAPGTFLIGENGDAGGITLARVRGDRLELRKLPGSRPGTTSAVAWRGRAYGVVAKLRYLAPNMAGQDPGPFSIYSVPLR